jgi:plasmid maintenance system antidote protein VapI
MKEQIARPEESICTKEAYSVKDIAEKLGMKERTAYAFCNGATEFKIKKIGRLLRINKKSFDEWWNN